MSDQYTPSLVFTGRAPLRLFSTMTPGVGKNDKKAVVEIFFATMATDRTAPNAPNQGPLWPSEGGTLRLQSTTATNAAKSWELNGGVKVSRFLNGSSPPTNDVIGLQLIMTISDAQS